MGGDGGARNTASIGSIETDKTGSEKAYSKIENWISKEALANIGDEVNKIDKRAASTRRDREYADTPKNENQKKMILNYKTSDGSRVILSGLNENKDSIYVVLDRIDRKYTLSESSLKAGRY